MKNLESELQIVCIEWFRYSYPQYRMLLFSIPNGGKRSLLTAVRMKREGVVSGVSDLFLSIPRHGYHGFYIEMKYGKNKLSENQEAFFQEARMQGYKCEMINSLDKFIDHVNNYLKPTNK